MRCDFCDAENSREMTPEGWMQVTVERYAFEHEDLAGRTVHICRSCQTYDNPTVQECLEPHLREKDKRTAVWTAADGAKCYCGLTPCMCKGIPPETKT